MFLVRYYFFIQFTGDELLQSQIGQKVEVEGVIVTEPDERDTSTRFVIQLDTLIREGKPVPLEKTKSILADGPYSVIAYGDRVHAAGVLEVPQNFQNENGREFDYISYLAKDKIFYEIKYAKIEAVDHGQGNKLKHILFAIKQSFIQNLEQALPHPESRLASGLVVAGKKSLPKEIQDEFQRTGTLQVVVLSGYNVTIIAEMIMSLSRTLSFRLQASFGILGIFLFAIMAGGSATIVRGGVMAVFVILAKTLRRRYSVSRALIITGFGMLLYNPMFLLYDPSFQLSFLATAGLIYVSPIVEKRLRLVPEKFGLRGIAASTIGAQLAVTPLLIYLTGSISLVSLPANVLISLIVPITMLLCFITGMLGYLGVIVALPISYIAFIFLTGMLKLVHFFSIFPFASINVPYFPLSLLILLYISFAVVLWRFYNRREAEVSLKEKTRTAAVGGERSSKSSRI
ncbi:ComEC family competence protein [Candidatus Parcubacteria bacterium]|nr:ComEC family competence protein [Candidatus Parcubacteria bacterium]